MNNKDLRMNILLGPSEIWSEVNQGSDKANLQRKT